MARIELDRVTVRRPTTTGDLLVLDETSLLVSESRVALIGPNGAGKSTLARLVNGLVTASTGAVHVDGVDVARRGREVRRRVAFTFTDPHAQLVMPTVAEDVALSLRARRPDRRARDAAVGEVLEQHGLAGLADRSVHDLSGGQAQLLALASVLATGPDVLVADEPTTLLDLAASRRVGDLLMGLPQQVLLVTHDLELAGRCDRALLVDGGRVVADGPAADVVHHYRARVAACS
ncbi:energy-coupling factor ABC transporter ATP-binding protein [Janibacter hoylei]|uniref:energy-coupling factor ABC transporter ATP-binding protein n=1 Tax=Janibacter hoylei TaxID=364298 RepID=UPI0021A4E205|nr:ABC transporter ATP-binding protein [Janibacter hoylei]MCT1619273.1 energy-coupling factor ABC transporter ATP-binding protein [Janibacter hoylei]MCT2293353.1 energy-coupling factor ABC transporter ATP-binding protein [Janibacter hoylei]MCW4601323.1 energy-coupling factor ABC transporter ATP-binding protein [Janibacter hoylei]